MLEEPFVDFLSFKCEKLKADNGEVVGSSGNSFPATRVVETEENDSSSEEFNFQHMGNEESNYLEEDDWSEKINVEEQLLSNLGKMELENGATIMRESSLNDDDVVEDSFKNNFESISGASVGIEAVEVSGKLQSGDLIPTGPNAILRSIDNRLAGPFQEENEDLRGGGVKQSGPTESIKELQSGPAGPLVEVFSAGLGPRLSGQKMQQRLDRKKISSLGDLAMGVCFL
ncbi:hypothetical protein RIF29_28832 [Crotalaria pallida]|uniref:Uncharacterized protein n=1 Tax=Crotalaria pallida TaxID=3830 RepID=A0AAN9EK39_CROPI